MVSVDAQVEWLALAHSAIHLEALEPGITRRGSWNGAAVKSGATPKI